MEDARAPKVLAIGSFRGLVSDGDPRDLERGQFQSLDNLSCEIPGRLVTRRGVQPQVTRSSPYWEQWSLPRQFPLAVRNVHDEPMLLAWRSIEGAGQFEIARAEADSENDTANQWQSLHDSTRGTLLGDWPPRSLAVTSAGEVFAANGVNHLVKWRGSIGSDPSRHDPARRGNEFVPAGIDAPLAAPTVAGSGTSGGTLAGQYLVAYRYVDYEGNPSNLSPFAVVDAETGQQLDISDVADPPESLPSYERIVAAEVFRSLVGNGDAFFRVATLELGVGTHADLLTDEELLAQPRLALQRPDGSLEANRFGTPPLKPLVSWHQDRLFGSGTVVFSGGTVTVADGSVNVVGSGTRFNAGMAGWEITLDADGDDETYRVAACTSATSLTLERAAERNFNAVGFVLRESLAGRNTVYFSEPDEPEAWPVEQNSLTLQADGSGSYEESVVAQMSFGPTLYVVKPTVMYAINSVRQPHVDAAVSPAFYRGALNQRCWAQADGLAFLMDRLGCYVFNHGAPQPIGDVLADWFREGRIDLGKSDRFHVSVQRLRRLVRFFVAVADENPSDWPMHALVYCYRTQTWWRERYPWGIVGAGNFRGTDGGERYYLLPENLPPVFDGERGCDWLPAPLRVTVTSAEEAENGQWLLAIPGLDESHAGAPLASLRGWYGALSAQQEDGRWLVTWLDGAELAAGDEAYVGGVPYLARTKRFSLLESENAQRRELVVWFDPQKEPTSRYQQDSSPLLLEDGSPLLLEDEAGPLSWEGAGVVIGENDARFSVRHYLDQGLAAVTLGSDVAADGDAMELAGGTPDASARFGYYRDGQSSGRAALSFFSTLAHDVAARRLIEFELWGVAAEARHRFSQIDVEGAVG